MPPDRMARKRHQHTARLLLDVDAEMDALVAAFATLSTSSNPNLRPFMAGMEELSLRSATIGTTATAATPATAAIAPTATTATSAPSTPSAPIAPIAPIAPMSGVRSVSVIVAGSAPVSGSHVGPGSSTSSGVGAGSRLGAGLGSGVGSGSGSGSGAGSSYGAGLGHGYNVPAPKSSTNSNSNSNTLPAPNSNSNTTTNTKANVKANTHADTHANTQANTHTPTHATRYTRRAPRPAVPAFATRFPAPLNPVITIPAPQWVASFTAAADEAGRIEMLVERLIELIPAAWGKDDEIDRLANWGTDVHADCQDSVYELLYETFPTTEELNAFWDTLMDNDVDAVALFTSFYYPYMASYLGLQPGDLELMVQRLRTMLPENTVATWGPVPLETELLYRAANLYYDRLPECASPGGIVPT